jgi:very-short-patch-repair endonuclease
LKSKRLELDIWVPSIKTAIEYDGRRWHKMPKAWERDWRKTNECTQAGIRLIRIPEEVYEKDRQGIIDTLLDILKRNQNGLIL